MRVGIRRQADIRNLLLLAAGFVCVLLLVSPVHPYPVNDDWAYSRAVANLLNGVYAVPPAAQAISLTHVAWGALFCAVFGFSFTALTFATLVMGAVGLAVFYLILRSVSVSPGYSIFGAALIALNPIYLHLSYSFMTDVTFLTIVLAACLCYLRGFSKNDARYFWLASILAGSAYLTRQFAILLVAAALLYLWWSGKWSWRACVAIAAVPLFAVVAYAIWESGQPVPLISIQLQQLSSTWWSDPLGFIQGRLQRAGWILTAPGLLLLPVVWKPRRLGIAGLVFLGLVTLQLVTAHSYGTIFPAFGNIVDDTGFVFGFYDAQPIWTQPAWVALGILGSLGVAVVVGICLDGVLGWVAARPWRERRDDPVCVLYLFAFLVAVVTLALPAFPFDRHLLPVALVFMVFALRRLSSATVSPVGWRWAALVPIGLFALLAQRDYNAHASARWQAAQQLVSQGVPTNNIDAGFEWAGWYLFDDGERHIRTTHDFTYLYFPAYAALDPVYLVTDLPRDGYTQVGSVSYDSWLTGGGQRQVLVMKRK